MCSQTVPTENRIEMEKKEINFSVFYFHFNYILALARDKQYCGNGDFFKLLVISRVMVKTSFRY